MTSLEQSIQFTNDIFVKHAKKEKAERYLFDLVYQWGKWGFVKDASDPMFQEAIKEFEKTI
jgi:hypothetical protein